MNLNIFKRGSTAFDFCLIAMPLLYAIHAAEKQVSVSLIPPSCHVQTILVTFLEYDCIVSFLN